MPHSDQPDDLRAAAVGIAAGLLAAWIMEQWQAGAAPLLATYQQKAGVTAPSGDATAKVADRVSMWVRGKPLPDEEKIQAGRKVHYAFGAVLGCIYSLVAGRWSGMTVGFGSAFSLGVDLLFDEALVPALKLSEPDGAYPVSSHVYGVSSHAIFGVALEGARRLLVGDHS